MNVKNLYHERMDLFNKLSKIVVTLFIQDLKTFFF